MPTMTTCKCPERRKLYAIYARETGEAASMTLDIIRGHTALCKTCQLHMARMTAAASEAVHPGFEA